MGFSCPSSSISVVQPVESRQTAAPLPSDEKSRKLSQDSPKTLYNGPIETQWPKGAKIGTGLNNTGNTCFLNSALQCLLHTPPLLHILLKHGHAEPCTSHKPVFKHRSYTRCRSNSQGNVLHDMRLTARHDRLSEEEHPSHPIPSTHKAQWCVVLRYPQIYH